MRRLYDSPRDAVAGLLTDRVTIMSGGFGLSRNPESLIPKIRASGVQGLIVISSNAGADGFGLWMLLESRQVRKMVSSYVGDNRPIELAPGVGVEEVRAKTAAAFALAAEVAL